MIAPRPTVWTRVVEGRRWLGDQSLRTRLVVLDLALFAGVASMLLVLIPTWLDRDGRAWMERKAAGQVELLTVAVAPALEFGDTKFLEEMLGLLSSEPDARCARVADASGRIVADWGDADACRGTGYLLVKRPILAAAGTTGTLEVAFSVETFARHQRETRVIAALFSLAVLGVGAILSYLVGGVLVAPLKRLTQASLAVAEGRMELDQFASLAAAAPASRDEARQLAHAVTVLTTQLGEQLRALDAERERAVSAETRALASSRAKSSFLANMSHELRTPLNAIIGYAEMLADDLRCGMGEANEQVADLDRIHSSGQHLLNLINDVLDLSKIEAGKLELISESFPFGAFVDEITESVGPLVQRNRNRLRVTGSAGIGELVTDRTRLKQCLLNLLSNACKFTQAGEVELTAERLVVDGGQDLLRITVRDTGIGIAPQHIGRLFQEFEQADASTTRRHGGSGLGLALTRRLCRMMGGDVGVSSVQGQGSTFTLTVPATASFAPIPEGSAAA